jgi:hypothetical protein
MLSLFLNLSSGVSPILYTCIFLSDSNSRNFDRLTLWYWCCLGKRWWDHLDGIETAKDPKTMRQQHEDGNKKLSDLYSSPNAITRVKWRTKYRASSTHGRGWRDRLRVCVCVCVFARARARGAGAYFESRLKSFLVQALVSTVLQFQFLIP